MKIFLNGCFDVLHAGHFNLLNQARVLAGYDGQVMVAIDTDDRISIKHPNAPIFPLDVRLANLRVLKFIDRSLIDHVVVFQTDDDLRALIQHFKPKYLMKGSDWAGQKIIGEELTQVAFYPVEKNGITEKISSSTIIKTILDRYDKAVLQEAFDAGGNATFYNGYPGFPDAPKFEEWYKTKINNGH